MSIFILHLVLIIGLLQQSAALDLSREKAVRIDNLQFNENKRGLHVLPEPKFFFHQLKNMCDALTYDKDTAAFFLCSHLMEKQKYFLPIFKHHDDDNTETDHVFMLELMPEKIYYHNEKPVAITSATKHGELRLLVPRVPIAEDRLHKHITEILQ